MEIHKQRESLKVDKAGRKSRIKYSSLGITAASSTIKRLAARPIKESRLLALSSLKTEPFIKRTTLSF